MIISTNEELRLHLPSNAVDDISILQGILDNSEKDFLRDKLGAPLYDALCKFYSGIRPLDYHAAVLDGTYNINPWAELLLWSQRMIANDAMARYAYQQAISINGAGINVSCSSDYDSVDTKLLDKSVSGFRKEALVALNNLLVLLEEWAHTTEHDSDNGSSNGGSDNGSTNGSDSGFSFGSESSVNDSSSNGGSSDGGIATFAEGESDASVSDASASDPDDDSDSDAYDSVSDGDDPKQSAISIIIALWKQSKYYYYQSGLLIPTAEVLNQYLDIYDNRDKFIRMLPDIRFIQKNYIRDAFGKTFITKMLAATSADDLDLLDDVRTLIALYLQERTSVIAFDKTQRLQAHNDAIALKDSIIESIKAAETASSSSGSSGSTTASDASASEPTGFRNNRKGNKMFVAPLLY